MSKAWKESKKWNAVAKNSKIETAKSSPKSMIGREVVVTLKDGGSLEGLLHAKDARSLRLDLPSVRVPSSKYGAKKGNLSTGAIVVDASDVARVNIKRTKTNDSKNNFHITDRRIGATSDPRVKEGKLWNRKLERCNTNWVEEGAAPKGLEEDNDGATAANGEKWDQFKHFKPVREGSRTDGFDKSFETMYSTPLDMSNVESDKLNTARKIAEEIQSKKSSNPHVAEERGHKVAAHLDAEDRYSGVLRKESTELRSLDSSSISSNGEKKKSEEEKTKKPTGDETSAEKKKKKPSTFKSKLSASSSAFVPTSFRPAAAMTMPPPRPMFFYPNGAMQPRMMMPPPSFGYVPPRGGGSR